MISYLIAKIAYNTTWIPWYLVFKFFLRYEVIYKDRRVRKLRGPLIIVANHSSWLDPFIVSLIFPIFSPAFPIRFATHPSFFMYIHTALFVRMYGCFRVHKKVSLEKNLRPALCFLADMQVVGIFPEGRKRHLGRPRKGRRGAAYLAIKTHTPILPCRIEGAQGLSLKLFLSRKRRVTVHVGQPFSLPPELSNVHDLLNFNLATEIIMRKISELKQISNAT